MKFKVKFKCYWYNTGQGDNHSYINSETFETLEEAIKFKDRVNTQYSMGQKSSNLYDENIPNPTLYQKKYGLTEQEYSKWRNEWDFIEIENGFIEGYAEIVGYHPPREEKINY
jgi:hypothetical protein